MKSLLSKLLTLLGTSLSKVLLALFQAIADLCRYLYTSKQMEKTEKENQKIKEHNDKVKDACDNGDVEDLINL